MRTRAESELAQHTASTTTLAQRATYTAAKLSQAEDELAAMRALPSRLESATQVSVFVLLYLLKYKSTNLTPEA